MPTITLTGALVAALALSVNAQCGTTTNLPNVTGGVFRVSTCIDIDAAPAKVWNAVVDFPSYPNWNPFVRSQIVCDDFLVPLENQTAVEGRKLIINVQEPPLPLPVNASTPANLLNAQTSIEQITHVQNDLMRASWSEIFLPSPALSTVRWNTVMANGANGSQYESLIVLDGLVAPIVQALYEKDMQESFDAMGVALKALTEGS